jgi:hypothetical protein
MKQVKHIGTQFTMKMAPTIVFTVVDHSPTSNLYKIKSNGFTSHINAMVFEENILDSTINIIPGKVDISSLSSTEVAPKIEKVTNYFNFDDI